MLLTYNVLYIYYVIFMIVFLHYYDVHNVEYIALKSRISGRS